MTLILQLFVLVALASGATRVLSEAAEWLLFGREAVPAADNR